MASNLPRADPRAASRICCEREGGGGGGGGFKEKRDGRGNVMGRKGGEGKGNRR